MWEEGVWEKKGRIWNGDHHGGPPWGTRKDDQQRAPRRTTREELTPKKDIETGGNG